MKLTDILRIEQVIPDLQGRAKRAVMEELCHALAAGHPGLDQDRLLEVLVERERLGSTGIGDGVAIPTQLADIDNLSSPLAVPGGCGLDSLDGKPAHLFFWWWLPTVRGRPPEALARITACSRAMWCARSFWKPRTPPDLAIIKAQDEEF